MLLDFLYYCFSGVLLLSAANAVFAQHAVINVLSLILSMFYAAGIFVLLKAEYLAFSLIIVYVGAVAVLFLFVVMMLDIRHSTFLSGLKQIKKSMIVLGIMLLFECALLMLYAKDAIQHDELSLLAFESFGQITNAHAIGQVLYTQYFLGFQILGLILFVGMLGAIILVYEKRSEYKKQNINKQLLRTKANSLEIVKFDPIIKKREDTIC